jgi:hypothetical protein
LLREEVFSNGMIHRLANHHGASAALVVLLLVMQGCCWIITATTTTTTTTTFVATKVTSSNQLDLSYLHRTEASSMKEAIQEGLQRSLRDNDDILAIDLTASLIDKDLQEVLSALQPRRDLSGEDDHRSPTLVGMTARRNQWTSKEAAAILESICKENTDGDDVPSTTDNEEKHDVKDGNPPTDSEQRDDSETNDTAVSESSVDDNTITTILQQSPPSSSSPPLVPRRPAFIIHKLDLGWNNFGSSGGNSNMSLKTLHRAMQNLLRKHDCPQTLRFDVCGLGPPTCRSMAKGILARYHAEDETNTAATERQTESPPLSLHLACNEGIGDAGAAALAAAVRTVASRQHAKCQAESAGNHDESSGDNRNVPTSTTSGQDLTILETLDLSGCSITDVGAEALAIALERHPLCIKHLDLSNNHITDDGAASLARALLVKTKSGDKCGMLETLDLSHNKDIGDRGAAELAAAFQEGCIQKMILRSCHLHADGASSFGTALKNLAKKHASTDYTGIAPPLHLVIDLSGNPLGILRKKPKSGSKYSASALKSKATETTAAYMGFLGKTVKKGLRDLGLAESVDGFDTLESDDEEESRMGKNGEEEDESKNKCGAISLAEAFVQEEEDEEEDQEEMADSKVNGTQTLLHVKLGLRHCSFDTRAAEALAAVLQESRKKQRCMKLTLDMTMNYVLEDETIAALHGETGYEDQISDMADNYLEAVGAIREAHERALEAARIARARAREEAELEDAWGSPVDRHAGGDDDWDGDDYDEAAWDSDADYDVPDEDDW